MKKILFTNFLFIHALFAGVGGSSGGKSLDWEELRKNWSYEIDFPVLKYKGRKYPIYTLCNLNELNFLHIKSNEIIPKKLRYSFYDSDYDETVYYYKEFKKEFRVSVYDNDVETTFNPLFTKKYIVKDCEN